MTAERKQAEEILLEVFKMGMDAQEVGMPSFDMIKQTGRIDKMIDDLMSLGSAEFRAKMPSEEECDTYADEKMKPPTFNRNIYIEGLNEGFKKGCEWFRNRMEGRK